MRCERGYSAYRALQGAFDFPEFRLLIDHVQADPFASPSHVRVQVPAAVAAFPRELYRDRIRRVALQDFLVRAFHAAVEAIAAPPRERLTGGRVTIDCGAQEVIERSAVCLHRGQGEVEARFVIGLPGAGRTVAGREACAILCDELPQIVSRSLLYGNLPRQGLKRFIECVEDQAHLRRQLDEAGLVGFVADGSILPRPA